MNTKSALFGGTSMLAVLITWFYALKFAPSEQHMGDVYRIIYLHVPAAITAFFYPLWYYLSFRLQRLENRLLTHQSGPEQRLK